MSFFIKEREKMKKYDLHIHSKFSDGEYTLEEIIKKLKENQIEIFSITDHDNVESISAMEEQDTKGLIYIPGIEFTSSKGKYRMHVLGYGIDGHNKELLETCKEMKIRKNLRNLEIIQQLREKYGIEITREETLKLLQTKSFVGQTTIARLLRDKGIIPNIKYAFDNYFSNLDLKKDATLDLDRTVKAIHNAGGVAVLAHPISIEKTFKVDIEDIFYIFKEAGIDGIEIFNSKHTLSDIKRYYGLARKEHLLISGGSDYHGEIMKPNVKLGKISKDQTEEKEHLCMTVIPKCLNKENQLEKQTNKENGEEIEL